jgi:4-amino-4-deoxy-L-arabinose transferase-like glycosyltransferase
VIYVAQYGSYPVLGKTLAGEQELAIAQGVYPRHTTIDPRSFGLAGLAYEAFQPPLYYYVAAPVTYLSGNYRTKALLLRFFGLFLLACSIALMARLSRHVLKERWLLGLAGAMVVFLLPNTVLRMVNISNENLAMPLMVLAVTELWIARTRKDAGRLLVCGLLVGCGILTDLFLLALVPVFLLVALSILRTHRTARDGRLAAAGGGLAVLLVLPWLIFNEVTYHALTANALAKREQIAIINPTHARYTIGRLPGATLSSFLQPLLPKAWLGILVTRSVAAYVAILFEVALILVTLVLAMVLGRRFVTSGYWILACPWFLTLVLCWVVEISAQWPVLNSRYSLPSLTLLALFGAAAGLMQAGSQRPVLIVSVAVSVFILVLWILAVPTISTL